MPAALFAFFLLKACDWFNTSRFHMRAPIPGPLVALVLTTLTSYLAELDGKIKARAPAARRPPPPRLPSDLHTRTPLSTLRARRPSPPLSAFRTPHSATPRFALHSRALQSAPRPCALFVCEALPWSLFRTLCPAV